jgi:glucosamine-phosphate N-acetyltransferase
MPSPDQPIFSPTLLPSTSLLSTLPTSHQQTYTLRPLQRDDVAKGYFECLATLTWVGDGDEAEQRRKFEERFDWMLQKGEGWFYNVVIEEGGRVVGTGVVIVERKL